MSIDEIPEDIRLFLLEHVESYEQLDILALLRPQAERSFSADEVAGAANIALSAAEIALSGLHHGGILEGTPDAGGPRFRYAPRNPGIDGLVDRLLRAYKENPLGIVKLMSANAIDRVRNYAIRAFANSFVLERKKKDG